MQNFKLKVTLVAFCFSLFSSAHAQEFSATLKKEISPSIVDQFLTAQKREFYLSDDGNTLLLSTDTYYSILDLGNNGEEIATGDHIVKAKRLTSFLLDALVAGNRDKLVGNVTFDEGTEFYVDESAGIVVFLDWSIGKNIVKAVDLKSGELLWETSDYSFAPSTENQMIDQVLSLSIAQTASRAPSWGVANPSMALATLPLEKVRSSRYSQAAAGFIIPAQGTGHFILKTKDGYHGLDLKSGAKKWTYDSDITVGFSEITTDGKIVLVNFNSSYFKASKKIIALLDPSTGQEVWRTSHLSDFRNNRTYVYGDRLVCDYYGAEVFDMKTGDRVLLTIDERTVKTQNSMTSMFMNNADGSRSTESIASPSILRGKFLYASSFKLGPREFANDGSSKAVIHKYDLETGEKIWSSDKLAKGTDLAHATPDFVLVRKGKAFGKSSLFILDAASGSTVKETDDVDGYISQDMANDVMTNGALYRTGKKSIYAFNQQDWFVKEYDVKKLGIGRILVNIPVYENLTLVGTEGVAVLDPSGEAKTNYPVANPEVYSVSNNCFIFSDAGLSVVDSSGGLQENITNLSVKSGDVFLFDKTGESFVCIKNENAENNTPKYLYRYVKK